MNCNFVHDKIRHQMIVWNISAPCGSSEKCGYTVSEIHSIMTIDVSVQYVQGNTDHCGVNLHHEF